MHFGRFELLERIGVGGMAEVWKARVGGVGGFEKIVVVKKILPAFAQNKTFIEMLLAEARLCAVLHHTNIVQTFENGEFQGQYYIAMEWVSGHDLFKILSRATGVNRRLPVEICLFIAAEVAKGLAYAHGAKDNQGRPLHIIHRDVSPSNVLVSDAGEVKVMDFGVARAQADGQNRDGQSRAGVLKGKLGYMSPEQVTGQPFDHRSDVFSLGIILYEAITLKRLFLGRTDLETLVNIRDARIEHKFRKHSYIEEPVRIVLRRALARNPEERYATALEMHDDIVNLLFEQKIQVTNRTVTYFLNELFDPALEVADQTQLGDEAGGPPPVLLAPVPRSSMPPISSRMASPTAGDPPVQSLSFSADEISRQRAEIARRRQEAMRPLASAPPSDANSDPGTSVRAETTQVELGGVPSRRSSRVALGPDLNDEALENDLNGVAGRGAPPVTHGEGRASAAGGQAFALPATGSFDASSPSSFTARRTSTSSPSASQAPARAAAPVAGGDAGVGVQAASMESAQAPLPRNAYAQFGGIVAQPERATPLPAAPPAATAMPAASLQRAESPAHAQPASGQANSALRPVHRASGQRAHAVSQVQTAAMQAVTGGPINDASRPYHIRTGDNHVLGPMSEAALINMIRSRSVTPDDAVSLSSRPFAALREVTHLRLLVEELIGKRGEPTAEGPISRVAFPELVFQLYADRATGCLEMHRDLAVKSIYFRRGRPQHIASNQRSEMLGQFLVSQGFVSQGDVDLAVDQAHATGGRLGDILVGLRLIKPYQLYQVLERQFRAKFIDAFSWEGGEYRFYPSEPAPEDIVPLDLDPISTLVEGVRSHLPLSVLEPYFEVFLDAPYRRNRNARISVESLRFQAREAKALGLLLSSRTLREAVDERCTSRQQKLAILHVLLLMNQTGLLTFGDEG